MPQESRLSSIGQTAPRQYALDVRYFLDTEYNGFGGSLLSLALVPEDGDELYLTLKSDEPIVEWVDRHVIPYLDAVPEQLSCPRLSRRDAAHALERTIAFEGVPVG